MMLEIFMLIDVLIFLTVHAEDNATTAQIPDVLRIISPLNSLVPAACASGGDLCENDANDKDCGDVFAAPNTKTFPPVVDPRCVMPTSFARMCAKTCLLCCQISPYNCEDRKDPPVSCTELKLSGLCNVEDGGMKEQIRIWCPQTCGLCPEPDGKCHDRNALHCRSLQRSCHDPDYKEFLKHYCPKTCNACDYQSASLPFDSSSVMNCSDTANYCPQYEFLCNVTDYEAIVADKCKRTCRRCLSSSYASCFDRDDGCDTWAANGFCMSRYYSVEEKRALCPKSCNLC